MWLFGDSFDHYTDLSQKYGVVGAGCDIATSAGRYGTNCARFTNASGDTAAKMNKGVTPGSPSAGAFCSLALFYAPMSVAPFCFANVWDASTGTGHVAFVRNEDGSISAWQQNFSNQPMQWQLIVGASTLIGTTAPLLRPNAYASVECFVLVHATAGVVRIRVNGAEVLNIAGVDTHNSYAGSTTWTSWYVGKYGTDGTAYIDDLMIYDDTDNGDGVTDFLGDLTAECVLVSAPGNSAQWTKNAGLNNAAAVAENPPDGDTTYVADDTEGHTDTYAHAALTRVASGIKCVQVVLAAKKTGAGTRAIAGVVRRSGTDYPGADQYLGTSYTIGVDPRPLDPSTGVAWAAADVNAAEIGPKVTV